MWERSARHNPLSIRYQTYADNRPVLPQDRAWDPIARRHYISNQIFYSVKCGRNKKYLSSNNIPMNDRLQLQKLLNFRFYMYKILKWAALVPTVLGSAFLFKRVSMPYKILYPLVFYLMFKFNRNLIDSYFGVYMSMNFSYYFHKYSHLTAEKIGDLQDPSKKHFRLDTDVYYRQTINELTGHGHGHDDSQGHGHHDTSTYYGPYPVCLF
jgi:hypothetical protein